MKRVAIIATVSAMVLGTTVLGLAAQAKRKSGEKKAIRQVAAAYTKAFNQGDAKALAALWTPQGDFIGPRGELIEGREKIEEKFADFFSLNPGVRLNITITSIRFVGADVAILDGMPEVTPPLQGPPVEARSTVILVKREGRWLVESVRDSLTSTPSNYGQLKPLEWMVGDWQDAATESDDVSVESTCDWTVNKNFIIRKFTAKVQDRVSVTGTQLIGWDPRENRIRSWVFDSSGGFLEGVWRRDGNRWIIETSGVLQDGSEVSSTNVLTRVDDDTFTFQSGNRSINGVREPDIEEIEIKRQGSQAGEEATPGSPQQPARETVLPP